MVFLLVNGCLAGGQKIGGSSGEITLRRFVGCSGQSFCLEFASVEFFIAHKLTEVPICTVTPMCRSIRQSCWVFLGAQPCPGCEMQPSTGPSLWALLALPIYFPTRLHGCWRF